MLMNKDTFDPIHWASLNQGASGAEQQRCTTMTHSNATTAPSSPSPATLSEVTDLVRAITSRGINITESYADWRNMGFALANALGEAGRGLYHELSQMSGKYKAAECDKQYSCCLRGRGSGITIASLFHAAKQAGVDLKELAREHREGCRTEVTNSVQSDKSDKSDKGTKGQNIAKSNKISNLDKLDKDLSLVTLSLLSLSHGTTFCDKISREDWPAILHPVLDSQSDTASQDKMMLATLNIISGLLPSSLYGIYDRRRVYAPLYNIIYGSFATRKGDVEACRRLAEPVKNEMRRAYEAEKTEYEKQMAVWESMPKASRGAPPAEPVFRTPFVAANSSASAVYRGLEANGGWGIMFETEADSLTGMLSKSEYGDYSDLLRKAHHHETCSMTRVSDKLHIELDSPRLSVLLTCTGSQIPLLLPASNVANGLASRFLFYELPHIETRFRNIFEGCSQPIDDIFSQLGEQVLTLRHALEERKSRPLQFILSREQQEEFVSTFDEVLKEQFGMLGDGIQGFIFRLALECFRYAMVLTALRRLSERYGSCEDIFDDNEQALACDLRDFSTAMTIVNCLVNHTGRVYSVIGNAEKDPFACFPEQPTAELRKFYDALPDNAEFVTADALAVSDSMNLCARTGKRYIGDLISKYQLLERIRHGVYRKTTHSQS